MLRGECVNGRWADEMKEVQPDGEIVYSRGEADYQGSVMFVAKLDDGRWLYCEWTYGSCSGCDGWEDMEETKRNEEMKGCASVMAAEEMKKYVADCIGQEASWITGNRWQYSQHVGLSVDDLVKAIEN